ERFLLRVEVVRGPGFALRRLRTTVPFQHFHPPAAELSVVETVTGRTRVVAGARELVVAPGEIGFRHPGHGCWAQVDAGEVREVRLSVSVLAEETGVDLRHVRAALVRSGEAASWRAAADRVERDVLGNPATANSALSLATARRTLALALREVFPALSAEEPVPDGGPGPLRRALAYLEDHAPEPITVADIAAAARLSVRSLQTLFQDHLATTPTAHLRRVRLAGAHRDLCDPWPGTGVGAVAAKWGFPDPGRFTAAYREQYGHSPRETLHRQFRDRCD
ncbi:helix-turn-helix transcriptional regulator, partial [Crossiella equi]